MRKDAQRHRVNARKSNKYGPLCWRNKETYQRIAQEEGGNHIDMIPQKSKHGQQQNIINQCQYCSGKHQQGACPALNKFCNKCGKKEHFASCCSSINSNTEKKESLAKVNQINNHSKVENQSDSKPEFFIGAILQSSYSDSKI